MAYEIISQNNTVTTLADENGNVIRVPSRAVLAVGETFTLTKVNNNMATLEDSSGKIYRDVPCVAVLYGGGAGGDQHNLGYYATQAALEEAYPTAEAGDWAIVGATDTVWIWDEDTSAWVDSDQKGQVTSVNGQTGDVVLDLLPDQTGQSGKFLTTDGTDASWSAVSEVPSTTGATQGDVLTVDSNGDAVWQASSGGGLQNTATGTESLGILNNQSGNYNTVVGVKDTNFGGSVDGATTLGYKAVVSSSEGAVAIGRQAKVGANNTSDGGIAIGYLASTTYGGLSSTNAICIGRSSHATGSRSLAIGSQAVSGAAGAIQLGGTSTSAATTNSDANTFKVANANGNFEIMSADGTIPEARLADTTNAQQGDVLTLDSTGNAVWQAGGGGGGSYTAGTGIDITNDVISTQVPMGAVSTYNFTVTTSGTDTLAIGAYARATAAFGSAAQSMAIGNNSYTYGSYSTAIGGSSYAKLYGTAVGANARADNWSTAVGSSVKAGNNGIALGCGGYTQQTGTADAFDIFMTSDGSTIKQYTMCDNNGQIPAARLGTGYDPTKTQTLKNVQGVLTWVDD